MSHWWQQSILLWMCIIWYVLPLHHQLFLSFTCLTLLTSAPFPPRCTALYTAVQHMFRGKCNCPLIGAPNYNIQCVTFSCASVISLQSYFLFNIQYAGLSFSFNYVIMMHRVKSSSCIWHISYDRYKLNVLQNKKHKNSKTFQRVGPWWLKAP